MPIWIEDLCTRQYNNNFVSRTHHIYKNESLYKLGAAVILRLFMGNEGGPAFILVVPFRDEILQRYMNVDGVVRGSLISWERSDAKCNDQSSTLSCFTNLDHFVFHFYSSRFVEQKLRETP